MISLNDKDCIIKTVFKLSDVIINLNFKRYEYKSLIQSIKDIIINKRMIHRKILFAYSYDVIYIFNKKNHEELESIYLLYYDNEYIKIINEEEFFKNCTCKIWEKDKGFLIDLKLFDYV